MALKKPIKGLTFDKTAARPAGKAATNPAGKPAAPPPSPPPIEKILSRFAAALPVFDSKALEEAAEEMRERPRASLQYLLGRLVSGDPATRAIAVQVLSKIGGAVIVDDLNALIFDVGQEAYVKVLANSLLAQLGSAVDPDVFAMTVPAPQAEEVERKLPSRALQLLKGGDVAGAVEHARTLHPAERWLIMHSAAETEKARALPFLEALARDDEGNATAAASVIAAAKLAEGVPFLLELQRTSGRELQKLIKKLLFDLREDGIEVPEEKPKALEPTAAEADDELPLHRAVASEPSPNGLILVTVARARPNGRLKVFSVLVDPWKRGIQQAGLRVDMSKSSFDRFLQSQSGAKLRMKETSLDECRKLVARGVWVAKEFGSPLPFDFGMGRTLLGDLDGAIAAIENPFLCSTCGKALDAETVEKIRTVAPYEQIPAETRCVACRAKPAST
ncbi:MAG: hypothetical protein ABSA67_15525 [Candidatus Brocadiia bacterium]|jgi:hypothetical protein